MKPLSESLNTVATILLVLAFGVIASIALAGKNADPVNHTRAGIAIKGYDPVAYFNSGTPTKGNPEISYEWNGATWRFAGSENRDTFAKAPEEYAPQYGGYCAYAVSQGTTANIDPAAWKIVDGKLYLNLSPRIQKKWEQDIPGYIEQADANWPKIIGQQ